MKSGTVEVAVGILLRDGRVWVQTRRRTGHLDGFLEFPGGKLETAESPLEALLREVREETGLVLEPEEARALPSQRHVYPGREVTLHFFLCLLDRDPPAGPGRWMRIEDLEPGDFPPANRKVLEWLKSGL